MEEILPSSFNGARIIIGGIVTARQEEEDDGAVAV